MKRSIVVVVALVIGLCVSGVIEGFVTGQPWPTWLRVSIGVVAEMAFLGYVFIVGRSAGRAGYTGVLGETDARGWAKTA